MVQHKIVKAACGCYWTIGQYTICSLVCIRNNPDRQWRGYLLMSKRGDVGQRFCTFAAAVKAARAL
jgi:hypothetical protein